MTTHKGEDDQPSEKMRKSTRLYHTGRLRSQGKNNEEEGKCAGSRTEGCGEMKFLIWGLEGEEKEVKSSRGKTERKKCAPDTWRNNEKEKG